MRTGWLGLLTGLVSLALLLPACARPPAPTPLATPATGAPSPTPVAARPTPVLPPPATPIPVARPTGELRIALSSLAGEFMDPTLGAGDSRVYLSELYDFLVGATPQGELSREGGLAENWEVSHGPTSSTYTFYLRKGIKFHNGDEVTAEDVKFSLEHFIRPASIASAAPSLRATIDKIEVAEPYKVVVRTKKPYGLLLYDLSAVGWTEGMVLPKKYFEERGAEYFNRSPIGSGPYRFKEQVVGSYVIYEALPWHWRAGTPKYKTITFLRIPEETTRIAALKLRQADIIDISRERTKEVKEAGFNTFLKPGSVVVGMRLGNTWQTDTYLYDKRVREALNLAMNRSEVLQFIFEGAGELIGHFDNYGSYAEGYKPLPLYPYEPERAKSLLKQAFPGGVELTINSYPWAGVAELVKMNEAIAAFWGAAGVKTKIVPMFDYATHRAMAARGALPNTVNAMAVSNRPFWHAPFRISYHSKGLVTTTKVPELDALIEAAEREVEAAKVGELQFKVAQFVRENHLYVPILETGALYAANPTKVSRWSLGTLVYELNLEELFKGK